MKIKIKHIAFMIIILIVILIFIGIRITRKDIYNVNDINSIEISENNYEELQKRYIADYLKGNENSFIFGYVLSQKNGNWEKFPLSEKFRAKYNEKDGILGDLQYDNIEYRPYAGSKEDYYFKDYYTYFEITQGLEKTVYIYNTTYQKDGFLLDDVVMQEIIKITDKDGNNLIIAGHSINEENFNRAFYMLSRGAEDERSIAVTDRFHRKYPYFLDLFEHYSPLEFNRIEYVSDKSSWERKEAYFIVDSRLECKKREYIVNFTLDDRGYLDEVVVKKVSEEEYEGDITEIAAKLLYNNSNWEQLKITDKYRERFKGKSYNNDIDKIDINYVTKGEYIDKNNFNEYLWQYRMKNGSTSVYYIKYIMDDKGNIDDIECIKLSYDNIPLAEAKELYLKEHN